MSARLWGVANGVLILLLAWVALEVGKSTCRQSTEPAALLPACDTLRVHHPDPRRLVRIVDCITGDTTVERGAK